MKKHTEIIKVFERLGFTIFRTSMLPNFVDFIASLDGHNLLIIIRDKEKSTKFRDEWPGMIHTVGNASDIVNIYNLIRMRDLRA